MLRNPRSWAARLALAASLLLSFALARSGFEDPRLLWYVTACLAALLLGSFVLSPEFLRARLDRVQPTRDPARLLAIRLLVATLFAVSLVDVGRFGWSHVPMEASRVALAVFVLSVLWVVWAMSVNPFFVPSMRLQPEPAHRVIDRGPYWLVRHPGYLGMSVAMPASALALGSWWGLIPAVAASCLFVSRAADEDRFLRGGLLGYDDYAGRVHHRLLPGIW